MVLSNDNLILYPTHPDLTLKSRSFGAKLVLDQISSGKFDPDTLYVFIDADSLKESKLALSKPWTEIVDNVPILTP